MTVERGQALLGAVILLAAAGAGLAQPLDSPRVTADEAVRLAKSGEAVLLDVRSKASYEGGHAEDAVNIPLEDVAQRFGELPKDKLILAYCT